MGDVQQQKPIDVSDFFPKVLQQNRESLIGFFKKGDLLLFEGEETKMRNADTELIFRQDSNFLYVTGIELPGCKFIIEVSTKETTLVLPDEDDMYPVWSGIPKPPNQWTEQYLLTRTIYQKQLKDFLEELKSNGRLQQLFLLNAEKSPFKEWVDHNNPELLKKALFRSRAIKTPLEIEIIKETCRISSLGHMEIMKKCEVGLTELHLESIFVHFTSWRGCRQLAYVPVIGTGLNGAVLHYNTNNTVIKNGDLIVVDAGCEYMGYASDITRTFPANGKFTEPQKLIYNIVLNTQKRLISNIRPGLDFRVLSQFAKIYLLEGLIQAKFINTSKEEALSADLVHLFMPHGLGHLLGLDVHDVSIYPETPLQSGMIITIEPGIYFNSFLIDKYINDPAKNKYLNIPLLESYRNFGGVRIEDDILVTDSGYLCLTELAPKETTHIEQIMQKENK